MTQDIDDTAPNYTRRGPRPPAGSQAAHAPSSHRPEFGTTDQAGRVFENHGTMGGLVPLSLLNTLLNIVTLTIWRFWGKTKVRRYLWGTTTAWGEPIEYTGTGKELFLGFLFIILAVFVPLALIVSAVNVLVVANPVFGLLMVPVQLFLLALVGAGLYRARRYQLSRTVWRGIRAGQSGSALRYGLLMLWVGVASILTLGWAWPWGQMKLARFRMNNTLFGNTSFQCDATAAPLYKRFIALWLGGLVGALLFGLWSAFLQANSFSYQGDISLEHILAIYFGGIVIGLICFAIPFAWYKAAFYARLAEHTRFDHVRFQAHTDASSLIGLVVGNWVITFLSLGMLRPLAALRTFRYFCEVVQVDGEPDWTLVAQNQDSKPGTGEGIMSVFDGGTDF